MRINSESLLVALTVAKYKSFSAAAQRLHKVPTAISYTVHKLEDSLGVKLFEMNGKQCILTEAGHFLLERAEGILSELKELQHLTAQMSSGVEARLNISLNNIVSTAPLFELIRQSEALFPQTEIHVTTDVHAGVWDALFETRADLIIGGPNQMNTGGGISCEPMGAVEWDFLVSRDHPLATHQGVLSHVALRAYPAVCVRDTAVTLEPEVAWRLNGQKALIAPDFLNKIQMQVRGLGIGFIPRHFACNYVSQGLLIHKSVQEPKQATPLYFAWNSQARGPCLLWWVAQLSKPEIKSAWTACNHEVAQPL